MTLTKIGASLSGGADLVTITQADHGFTVGKVLRSSGSNGAYATALADTAANAEVIGIVIQRIDDDTFTMALSGRITADGAVLDQSAGTVLFLSASSTGDLTQTEPTTAGLISKPVAVVTTADSEMLMVNYRGEIISTSTESWDVNGSELILDVDGDTSLHANNDDQIDVQIAGADDFRFTANTLSVLSGSTLSIDSGATLANSGTLSGFSSSSFTVTQSSHGLAVGNVVKSSGSNGAFAKAQADSVGNAEVVGVVTVVSGNDITITTSGEIAIADAVPNVAAGVVVFLHEDGSSDEGTLTSTEPTGIGEISKPIAIVTHQNSKMVLLPFRGEVITNNAASIADDSVTTAKILNLNVTNAKVATGIDAVKLADGSVTNAEFQYINSLSSNAQAQLTAKAPLASPTFTGNPVAPTQSAGNNSTRIATTAYVDTLSTGIDWETSARTANFTAVAGKGYAVDCSGAARTVTLPAGSVGDIIALVDYSGNAATNNITITANGSEKILGDTSDVTLNVGRMAVHLVYFDTTQGWIIPWGTTDFPVLESFNPSGGTLENYSGYKVNVFLSGTTNYVVNISGTIDVLMVAGGGGGGSHHAGAGGAGGVIVATGITIAAGTYSMVVGAGGAANAYGAGDNGSNTTAFGATATGGGSGGKYQTTAAAAGGSGGGGNGHVDSPWKDGASGTQANVTSGTLSGATGYGNDGGDSSESHLGGGGGGAGAVGGNNAGSGGSSTAGIGGVGISNVFRTGSGVYYGGGGGGGNWQNTFYAAGGNGGGGAGGGGGNATSAIGTDGTVNTGGGGGGSGSQGVRAGGDGGSGIVVIRYSV